MKELLVNEKLKNVVPAPSAEEYAALELSIKNEGCREAIIVWREKQSDEIPTIIDGHNRYEICVKNNVEFQSIEKEFPDMNHVIEWMITNQISRRNLHLYKRACLALDLAEILKQRGKEKERTRKSKKTSKDDFHISEKVDSSATVAKQFGVSEGIISQVKFIKEKELAGEVSPEIMLQLTVGNIKIGSVYSSLKGKNGGNRIAGKTVTNHDTTINEVINKSTPASELLDIPVKISSAAIDYPLSTFTSEIITDMTCSTFEEALNDEEEMNIRERALKHLMQFISQFEGYSCLADEVEEIKILTDKIKQFNESCKNAD